MRISPRLAETLVAIGMAAASTAAVLLNVASCAAEQDAIVSRIDVHTSDLNIHGITGNWLSYNGDYTGRRYSSLSEITRPMSHNYVRSGSSTAVHPAFSKLLPWW